MKVSRGRIASSLEEKATKLQFVVSNQVTNSCCGLAVIFCGFISLLIGRETINIPEIFSGVHGFTEKTVNFRITINALAITHTKQGITVKPVLADTLGALTSVRLIQGVHCKPVLIYYAILPNH